MDRTTTFASSNVEWQVSPHEAGSDMSDSQDIPLPDSQKVPQPDSQKVPQPNSHEVPPVESEDIPHPDDLALPVLKENKVWTIGMFRRIYLCIFMSNVNTIYIY